MDTICAIATPSGGAIGIVRVSGPQAIAATASIFRPAGKTDFSRKAGGTLTFGQVADPTTGDTIDEVLVSLFRAPHSYTGEDSCEISCHGSAYILHRTIELLIAAGCRLARPGEYTERAFLNGKMDLSQAEAVADLIACTTGAAHRMAVSQMRGAFSAELRSLRDRLLHITSLLELELDFSDHEDLEFASRPDLLRLVDEAQARISSLCGSFRLGNALKRGVPVAIAGETNAGKSTLLNTLVGENRALVSDVRGTTRDTIEETVTLGDTLVRLIDTAGLRDTDDEVERMGIARAEEKVREAEITLWLIDLTDWRHQYDTLAPRLFSLTTGKRLIIVLNKRDLVPAAVAVEAENHIKAALPPGVAADITAVSVQYSSGAASIVTLLSHSLDRMKAETGVTGTETIVSNLRHYEALSAALSALSRVRSGLSAGLSADLVSQDLRECLHHLGSIVGDVTTDEVLSNIFKHFCIGK